MDHTGLAVYNINQCYPFSLGVFVWYGDKWVPLSKRESLYSPSLTIKIDTLHLPSGMDARISEKTEMDFVWNVQSPTFTAPVAASSGSMSGGLVFTSPRGWTPVSGNWTESPALFSVWADDMTNSLVTSTNPWRTRQSKVTFSIPANACGAAASKDVFLNQTNYAIIAGTGTSPLSQIYIRNTNASSFNVLSNTPWIAKVISNGTWTVSDVLQNYTSVLRDATSSNGTTGTDYNFDYTGAPAARGKRFSTATVTLKDPAARAKDFIINVTQCQGTPDINDVVEATNAETSGTTPASWSGKIVHHQKKDNVYEEFYSADFGNAGRWMITNLAAKAYDGFPHSAGRQLSTTPTPNTNNANHVALWAYPSATSLTSSTEYDANPHLGYLYTWDAATGGKGTIPRQDGTENGVPYIIIGSTRVPDGKYNIDKMGTDKNGWANDRSEAGMLEWTGTASSTARPYDSQARRQGICPKGWHLPSDYEWTQLEQEIVRNTKKYADVYSNIDSGNGAEIAKVPQAAIMDENDKNGVDQARGTTHGQAMKDACEPDFTGTSNHLKANGFSALLTGYGLAGKPGGYENDTMFWTSSVAHADAAYGRILSKGSNTVYRYRPYRYHQFSVRCKKD